MSDDRSSGVFINCPFDAAYRPLFDAIVFAVIYCGLEARSGLQIVDAGQPRLNKIMRQIEQSRFSIHDISRVGLDAHNQLPRFNMPLELGLALGMKHLGRKALRDHVVIIMDSEPNRYHQFASDLAGVDINHHGNEPAQVVTCIRNALADNLPHPLPSAGFINAARNAFEQALPDMAARAQQDPAELTFNDRLRHLVTFVEATLPE